jgi:hypothetical protein
LTCQDATNGFLARFLSPLIRIDFFAVSLSFHRSINFHFNFKTLQTILMRYLRYLCVVSAVLSLASAQNRLLLVTRRGCRLYDEYGQPVAPELSIKQALQQDNTDVVLAYKPGDLELTDQLAQSLLQSIPRDPPAHIPHSRSKPLVDLSTIQDGDNKCYEWVALSRKPRNMEPDPTIGMRTRRGPTLVWFKQQGGGELVFDDVPVPIESPRGSSVNDESVVKPSGPYERVFRESEQKGGSYDDENSHDFGYSI